MATIARRLALVRESLGLSLRGTAALLKEAGYPVSHDAVHKYERGRKVPAEYVRAFCDVFGCRTDWVLSGEGSPLEGAWERVPPGDPSSEAAWSDLRAATSRELAESARAEWERFIESGRASDALRPLILRSWERARAAGVRPEAAANIRPRRLSPEEVEDRRARGRALLEAAEPDLDWLTSLHRDIEHVAYVVCPDGIVLESRAEPSGLAEEWSLLPGHDWSEEAMGTNGAGTALFTGKPTAVIGAEHYVEGFHGCTCVAAPVFGRGPEVVGAIDLTTTLEETDPRRLVVVAYAAEKVSEKLRNAVK